jgi:hypothetical protein
MNFFPIEGERESGGVDPARMNGEKPLLIYPIGTIDADPEELIEFKALSPVPRSAGGFLWRRALVTIEVFRLADSVRRKNLFKLRAILVRLLYLELELRAKAATSAERQGHEAAIQALTYEAPLWRHATQNSLSLLWGRCGRSGIGAET